MPADIRAKRAGAQFRACTARFCLSRAYLPRHFLTGTTVSTPRVGSAFGPAQFAARFVAADAKCREPAFKTFEAGGDAGGMSRM